MASMAGSMEVGRHVPIPATSEEAHAAVSLARTRAARVAAWVAVAVIAAAVGAALMAGMGQHSPAMRSSMAAPENKQDLGQLATKGLELADEAKPSELALDKEAWEKALQTAGQVSGSVVASKDAGNTGSEPKSPAQQLRGWDEASRQEARDKLAKMQDKFNKALEEMNKKILATQNMTPEEAAAHQAAHQKKIEDWHAHPDHATKKQEAREASQRLQEMVRALKTKHQALQES